MTCKRYVFKICPQEINKTIDAPAKIVRALNSSFEFGVLCDSLMRGQIMLGTQKSEAIRGNTLNGTELILKNIKDARTVEENLLIRW